MTLPEVVSRQEWLVARKQLLDAEKEATRLRDVLSARRRSLPMVRIDKPYSFESPDGPVGLLDLFEGRRQLILRHFMFDPERDEGCSHCSFAADNVGHLAHLHARDTSFAVVSRAPLAKIEPFRRRMGWQFPWYSTFGSDFNYDFHVTLDESVAPVEYNYRDKATLTDAGLIWFVNGEQPGVSVFLRDGEDVFHTYSTYARGSDLLLGTYNYLDLTPLGRQETNGQAWVRHHDRYSEQG